ncbi:MAG: redoxin domain-containing protein [Thermodesulfobacteriota bacterium]
MIIRSTESLKLKSLTLTLLILTYSGTVFAELTPGTPAPEFPKDAIWIGTNGKRLSMEEFKGKVVLIDFWEYTCINCVRTFSHLKEWYRRYHKDGLEIIGVHKGEFDFASDPENVKRAHKRFSLPYPAIADVDDKIWDLYDSNFWPNSFLIDRNGIIREVHNGEGDYGKFEKEIQNLLKQNHPELDFSKYDIPPDKPLFGSGCGEQSEEIYIGYLRGSKWGGEIANSEGFKPEKTVDYAPTENRVKRGFFVKGGWTNRKDFFESVTPSEPDDASYLGITYRGRDVYSVLGRGTEEPAILVVTRDGLPIPRSMRGQDIMEDNQGQTLIKIDEPRMYYVVTKEDDKPHELSFFPKKGGIRIYSFTFGNKCLENFDRL